MNRYFNYQASVRAQAPRSRDGELPTFHLEFRLCHVTRKGAYFGDFLGNIMTRQHGEKNRGKLHIQKPSIHLSPSDNKYSIKRPYAIVGTRNFRVCIHRIVAQLFCPNSDLFAVQVDHVNGNCYDNCAWNLEWVTREENIRRAVEMRRVKKAQNAEKL